MLDSSRSTTLSSQASLLPYSLTNGSSRVFCYLFLLLSLRWAFALYEWKNMLLCLNTWLWFFATKKLLSRLAIGASTKRNVKRLNTKLRVKKETNIRLIVLT